MWSFFKLVNHSNLGNYLIFQIWYFWGLGLEFQRANMRIGEITNRAKYWKDEGNQNLPIFGVKFWFSKLKRKILKISQILQFRGSSNFHYRETHKTIKFLKLLNFKNEHIFKISQFVKLSKFRKISNLMVNYHICILSIRMIQTIIKIKKQFENRKIE